MNVIKISGISDTPAKPAIWIDAGIHGREWVAPVIALNIANKVRRKKVHFITLNFKLSGAF